MDCLELVFLVARFLHRSLGLPLDSVEALLAQAQMMQTSSSSRSLREGEEGNPLLPQRLDWRGIPHPLSYLQLVSIQHNIFYYSTCHFMHFICHLSLFPSSCITTKNLQNTLILMVWKPSSVTSSPSPHKRVS